MKRVFAIAVAAVFVLLSQAALSGNAPQKASGPAETGEGSAVSAPRVPDARAQAEDTCRQKNLAGPAYEECVKLELAKRSEKEPAAEAPKAK